MPVVILLVVYHGKIETAKNLRKIGMDIKVISEATNLPIEKLRICQYTTRKLNMCNK